ncbi:hypothetical protein BGZ70_009514 [Mortierella alpina]|uniref:Chitin-binding type-2 domain-containing protein n=1 Tax=Mortierella alpina TaxID=64518 RepID=A0A9P6JGC1_MORAP|nr:hypothetical protein BGZ70_009514 [Mortierella alpina]
MIMNMRKPGQARRHVTWLCLAWVAVLTCGAVPQPSVQVSERLANHGDFDTIKAVIPEGVLDAGENFSKNEPGTKPECPRPNGLFSLPRNCTEFIYCNNSVPQTVPCPDHYEFNSKDEECQRPEIAGCSKKPELTTKLRETVRLGQIDVYKQCYSPYDVKEDVDFYKFFFIEVDISSYYCKRNCMVIGDCSLTPPDRFMTGSAGQDGICIFWNINYYYHDDGIFYAQSSATLEKWKDSAEILGFQSPTVGWSITSKPTLFYLPLTSGQRSMYLGLGRGIKRISIPFVHFQKDSSQWGKMVNVRFDASIHDLILKNSDYKGVKFDKQFGIIGGDAILHLDYDFLAAGDQLGDDIATIVAKSMRYYPAIKYASTFSNRYTHPASYQYESGVLDCEQGKSFEDPVSKDTILQSILTGAIKMGLSFIPGFGPLFAAGLGITSDYFNNPTQFERNWIGEAGDAGKGIWGEIKLILDEYKATA